MAAALNAYNCKWCLCGPGVLEA